MSTAPAVFSGVAPDESAALTFTRWQVRLIALTLLVMLVAVFVIHAITLKLIIAVFVLGYVVISVYKMYVLYISVREGTPQVTPITGDDVPIYTILVPLYHEAEVLPALLKGLEQLDYPPDRLQVLLLLEENDEETREACAARTLPSNVQVVVVPEGRPKTKPRACNFGLATATGEYLVIFDAEDRPEPDQLRKALSAFASSPPDVICQQAKLHYYNQRQNTLTKLFTIDYLGWFEGILPGLTHMHAPIPLGGTSNHFRVDKLREVGGWDAFNVAEDADLGVRLARRGYKAAIFNSITWEEATANVRAWIRQRSRWIKGYMQTLLVHSRHPRRLWRELGPGNSLGFFVLAYGTPFTALSNPLFWLLGVIYYATRSTAIEALFFTPIYYLGLASLIIGNFVFVYVNVVTAARWGYNGLAKWALLTPLYWILLSIAGYAALYELIVRPHHWQKTKHGLNMQFDTLAQSTNQQP
jgi:cellulose synthase/poly-beta-1,6-N-acetylglucosamine synthase-like glycosyltransferase